MPFPETVLQAAHQHSSGNRAEIAASEDCGCFFCCQTIPPADIEEWWSDGTLAVCPNCGIDSVLGSASDLPVTDPQFLRAMREYWFERIHHHIPSKRAKPRSSRRPAT